jgi:MOSC domain-containing protein YiiM
MKIKHIIVSKDSKYYSGKLRGIENNPNAESELVEQVECHAGKGLVGDRYYDIKEDFKGQVTFISYELHQELEKAFNKKIDMKEYRRNIFVTGINPVELVGKKFQVGEVQFEGTEDCAPCKFMDQYAAEGAWKWMKKHKSGGLRAKVLTDGTLKVGDELK